MISQNTQNQIIYDSSVVPALVAEPAFASGEVGAQHCLPLGVVDLDPRPRAVRLWVVHVPVHPSHTHTTIRYEYQGNCWTIRLGRTSSDRQRCSGPRQTCGRVLRTCPGFYRRCLGFGLGATAAVDILGSSWARRSPVDHESLHEIRSHDPTSFLAARTTSCANYQQLFEVAIGTPLGRDTEEAWGTRARV